MTFFDFLGGKIDAIDAKLEKNLEKTIFTLRDNKILKGAIDVSEGGIIGALMEGLFNGNSGFEGKLITTKNPLVSLFGEITGRYIISTNNDSELLNTCLNNNIPVLKLGKTNNSSEILFDGYKFNLSKWKNIYETIIEKDVNNV